MKVPAVEARVEGRSTVEDRQPRNSCRQVCCVFVAQAASVWVLCVRYTHYEVLGDPSLSKSAGLSRRYSEDSLRGVIIDIHLLSLTDYLVCTFSSQVSSCFVLCSYTVSQKNDTDVARYNFNSHRLILVIFGRDVAEGVCYQTMICYPTSPN